MSFKRIFSRKSGLIGYPAAGHLTPEPGWPIRTEVAEGEPVPYFASDVWPPTDRPAYSLAFVEKGCWRDPDTQITVERYNGTTPISLTVLGSDAKLPGEEKQDEKYWRMLQWYQLPKSKSSYAGPSFVWVMVYAIGKTFNSSLYDGKCVASLNGHVVPSALTSAIVDTSRLDRVITFQKSLPWIGGIAELKFDNAFALDFDPVREGPESVKIPQNKTGLVIACYREKSIASGLIQYV